MLTRNVLKHCLYTYNTIILIHIKTKPKISHWQISNVIVLVFDKACFKTSHRTDKPTSYAPNKTSVFYSICSIIENLN